MAFRRLSKRLMLRIIKHSFLSLLMLGVFIYVAFCFLFLNKSLPNSYFALSNVSGRSRADVEQIVTSSIDDFSKNNLTFYVGFIELSANVQDLGISFDNGAAADEIYSYSRRGSFLENSVNKIKSNFFQHNVGPHFTVDAQKFNAFFDLELAKLEKPAMSAGIVYLGQKAQVVGGTNGVVVDRVDLAKSVSSRISSLSNSPIALVYLEDKPAVGREGVTKALDAANTLSGKTIVLTYKYDKWPLAGQKLLDLFRFEADSDFIQNYAEVKVGQSKIKVKAANLEASNNSQLLLKLSEEKVDSFVSEIAKSIDRPAQNATLTFDGSRVTNFVPALDGQALDVETTRKQLLEKIGDGAKVASVSIEVPVKVTHARIANEQINKLGIVELIGTGVSYFAGSIPNRVFNIGLGSSLITGTIVPPGEIFSFNALVGPVSADQGFKQAYVINKGRTVLDDGGGICQVSTTVFRAALNAGFPIVKRTAHAYRVAYYEQHGFKPGLDATIFSPSVDLQFKNDTSNHILVQTVVDRTNARLEVDIYGTSDGRRVEISDPVVTKVTPAPEPLYQDDPTLPKGTKKQVDFAAAGATAVFTRKVYMGNELIINETIRSNFRPWQAVYLVGTGG